MNAYQKEQYQALQLVREHLATEQARLIEALGPSLAAYLGFRRETDRFLHDYFSDVCTTSCYQNQLSACCSKDGIITFFADVVINALYATEAILNQMAHGLQQANTGSKCIYLSESGCLWHIKPIVCQMFLCDKAQQHVFEKAPSARHDWDTLKKKKKTFTWPDKPVLFDRIEALFLEEGHISPLMYCHNSPGLLRVKQQAGLV